MIPVAFPAPFCTLSFLRSSAFAKDAAKARTTLQIVLVVKKVNPKARNDSGDDPALCETN